MTRMRALQLAGGTVAVVLATALGYERFYAADRREALELLGQHEAAIRGYERALESESAVRAALGAFSATTLGSAEDKARARLRSALGQIAQTIGLEEIIATDASPQPVVSPAALGSGRVGGAFGRLLRESPDFRMLSGRLSGVGTLEQVLRALAMVQAQPWAHRVTGFAIEPVDTERNRFRLRADVVTLLAGPGGQTDSVGELEPPRADAMRAAAQVLAHNVFRVPKPVVASPAPAPAPAPPRSPLADWKLTGVGGTLRLHALLVNVRTGERAELAPGQQLEGAEFVSGAGEEAVFEIDGKRIVVRTGQMLLAAP